MNPSQPIFSPESLDWTQFQSMSDDDGLRLAVDMAPTTTQKNSMSAHKGNNEIIWNISRLFCQQHISEFIISQYSEATLNHYSYAIYPSTLSPKEYQSLCYLLHKAGYGQELMKIDTLIPRFHNIPLSLSRDAEGLISFRIKDQVGVTQLDCRNFADMKRLFIDRDGTRIMISAFFYFLDLRELLSTTKRPRGQTIPRFLKVFASPTLNNLYYAFFLQLTHAGRLLLLENGLNWDNITLEQIIERVNDSSR